MTLPEKGSEHDRLEEEIRLRAYYRFLARGPDDGSDVDDWLRAAEEIRDGRKGGDAAALEGHETE